MARYLKFVIILVVVAVLCFWGGYSWREQNVPRQTIPEPVEKISPNTAVYDYLKIFRYDPDSDEEVFGVYIAIPSELPLKEKLSLFAEKLSNFGFRGLPIELLSIDSSDGRRIAKINLKEIDTAKTPSWKYIYFQGSSGGGHTTRVLVNSFLQEDYPNEWVDGVEFYYEGRPLREFQFDHISLEEIKLRGQQNY